MREHLCYTTCYYSCRLAQNSIPLRHPKNNLFTLKKLILIENKRASRETSSFSFYMDVFYFLKDKSPVSITYPCAITDISITFANILQTYQTQNDLEEKSPQKYLGIHLLYVFFDIKDAMLRKMRAILLFISDIALARNTQRCTRRCTQVAQKMYPKVRKAGLFQSERPCFRAIL